ncbi:MAG: hypothetical protein L6V93_09220 [Clostridiales bacterium]|nr:MAG: hypothetical protein L6V93_09220 [Clostridiales bacterium]
MAERHGISHGLLRLEITESAYLTETEELKSAVTAFKKQDLQLKWTISVRDIRRLTFCSIWILTY